MDRKCRYIIVLICPIFISYEFLPILIYLIVNNIQVFFYILTKKRMKIKGKSNGEKMGGNGWGRTTSMGHGKVGVGISIFLSIRKFADVPCTPTLPLLCCCLYRWHAAVIVVVYGCGVERANNVFEGWVGVQECTKHEKHNPWMCFSCWRLGGAKNVLSMKVTPYVLEGWRGPCW